MKNRSVKRVVVIGGGTAGWMTALYAQKMLPNKEIIVVDSDGIGIIGAGEGTTPHLVGLLDVLEIPLSRMIAETGSTIKNGIKFTNWNGGGEDDYYYHAFAMHGDVSPDWVGVSGFASSVPVMYAAASAFGDIGNDNEMIAKASEQNKVIFLRNQMSGGPGANPIEKFTPVGNFAVHFDGSKLAGFFRNIATNERGIERIEGVVSDFEQDSIGDVRRLTLASGQTIDCDFIFDCTGFKRLFANKFETEWVSHKKHLPANATVPFFTEIDQDNIPPYSEGIAMKYGWMFKIPLQHRYGCGYVYDSTLISVDDVKKEIEDYLGYVPFYPRKEPFTFEAGYYKESWKHNVVTVGLAAGFIEPLEATSLWVTILTLSGVLSNPEIIYSRNPIDIEEFNEKIANLNEEIADFIYWHYYSDRNDTEFWKKFNYENATNGVKKYLDIIKRRLLRFSDFSETVWSIKSWYVIGLGLRNERIRELLVKFDEANPASPFYKALYVRFKNRQNDLADNYSVSHGEFLQELKNGPLQEPWTPPK